MTQPGWLFFGCLDKTGHRLVDRSGSSVGHTLLGRRLSQLDGLLAPLDPAPYRGCVTHLHGFGVSALSFWDHTVDTRPGANVIVFAPTPAARGSTLLIGFERFFPKFFQRMPPIVLLENIP